MNAERFVGIDVSKDHLDVAVRPDGTHRRVPNTDEGLDQLVAVLGPLTPTLVVLEATGGYQRRAVAEAHWREHMRNANETWLKGYDRTALVDVVE